MSSRWQEGDHSNEDAATTFHAQVLKIARAGGRSLRQRIWSDAYRFPRGSAQDPGPITATLIWAGDTFLTVPYRPILARLDCHSWLSVRRPERRLASASDVTLGVLLLVRLAGVQPGGCMPVRERATGRLQRRRRRRCTWRAGPARRGHGHTASWSADQRAMRLPGHPAAGRLRPARR